MINKKGLLIFISFLISIPSIFYFRFLLNNKVLIKSFILKFFSDSQMQNLSKYILPYREIKILEKDNRILKNLEKYGVDNDKEIKESMVDLYFENNEIIKLKKTKLFLEKYNPQKNFIMRGIYDKVPGSAYIDNYQNQIILLSSTGILGSSQYDKKLLKFKQIKNNIGEFINEKQFKKSPKFSIKDLFISNEKIYLSFTNEVKENCWNTSIIFANFNFKEVKFEPFFMPDECVNSLNNEDKVFEALQSGGRISELDKNQIIFTTGEFRSRSKAQDKDSVMGKILKINKDNKKFEVLAMGMRNAQGLYYDKTNKYILTTEHGPKGGDEINLIAKENSKKIFNLGWPISSYGEHYLKEKERLPGWSFEKNNPYLKYPLHKSHIKYGFLEPIKFYTPSIGISQIQAIDEKNKIYIHASLVDQSLYLFKLSDNNEIIKNLRININERIRDINKADNKLFLFLETTSSIGIIDLDKSYKYLNRILEK